MIKTPIDLFSKMYTSGIQYGLFDKTTNKIITYENPLFKQNNYLDENCRVMKPKEVWQYNAGTCWDCALMEYVELKEMDKISNVKMVYYEYKTGKTETTTHTTISFKSSLNQMFYWFEYSWYRYRGINGPFDSEKDLNNTMRNIVKKKFPKIDIFNESVNVNRILKMEEIRLFDFITVARGN